MSQLSKRGEQHPDQLREKKACGSRRDTAHHIAIVGTCSKQWASGQPVAHPMLLPFPHEQMYGQHARMFLLRPCHSLWHDNMFTNRNWPVSGWLLVGARVPTDGGPRKSTNGLETEGGTMPRGDVAGAVEVNGFGHGASRGGASGTTPQLDCGEDVGRIGIAVLDCGIGTNRSNLGTLDAERENGLVAVEPLEECWSKRSGTPGTAPENELGCTGREEQRLE